MTPSSATLGTLPLSSNQPRWFSDNPDRAWGEKFFLAYSPLWMLSMAMMMFTGWQATFSDTALLLHSLSVALPLLVLPMFLYPKALGTPWRQSYWLKANLYIAIFSVFGNYFGSEYFFDVLGMVYHFPNATTTLDPALVGHNDQPVPVIMYFYTHAYFMTYHTTAVLVLRRLMSSGLPLKGLLFLPLTLLVGYAWAWMETKAMANPLMASSFYYTNMPAMLAFGSLIYATYFIASFPIFYFLDEHKSRPWSLAMVCSAGLSASMLVFYLLEICTHGIEQL
ncbi:hypothetical protein [Ketobacter sp.]|uniref:hypothetical protein n=1 Tax=Ketobacter sp. TaxID=2083498 RepID=UPI000F14898A|nr:hypothetical protein [Ketobacter sp.]RLT93067.1 MAG: hypothetical protein D9N14_19630 [Ketobacter sp.]